MRLYEIALTLVPGIGDAMGKKLVTICGSAEAVFTEKKQFLAKVPRVGQKVLEALSDKTILERAEKELAFVEKFRIRTLFFLDADYPFRLKNCIDGPVLLYYKGNADLNSSHMVGVVGTRKATEYGRTVCTRIISELAPEKIVVVSGLAYGIDSCAHRSALDNNLQTIGVLGHGLDRIRSEEHTSELQSQR